LSVFTFCWKKNPNILGRFLYSLVLYRCI